METIENRECEGFAPKAEPGSPTEGPLQGEVQNSPEKGSPRMIAIPLEEIVPNPRQPRKHFDQESLQELAESIRSIGLLQPLAVRPVEKGYELISGERRLRACKLLGLETAPAVILHATDKEQHVMALVENIQRQDLSPLEEATSLSEILEHTGESQSALAERLGRSQAAVANKLRLLRLEEEVQLLVQQRLLGERQARALVGLDREAQLLLAQEAVDSRMPAKDVEAQAKIRKKPEIQRRKKKESFKGGVSTSPGISGPDGPTGELLQELVSLVEGRKAQGMPVILKVRELQQSQLVVEVQVNLADWKTAPQLPRDLEENPFPE